MAMTLRLTDEEAKALRAQAEREGRSMQTVVRAAILEYVERQDHHRRVAASSSAGAKYYDEALKRLGEA